MNDENLSANELEQLLGDASLEDKDSQKKAGTQTEKRFGSSSEIGNVGSSFKFIEDVSIKLTIELGRKKMPILEVSKLKQGNILELDKNIGQNLDLLANGKKVGEVRLIAMDEYYGFQIIDILEPLEYVQN